MPLPVYRLRRWLAGITVLFIAVVAGMYLFARLRQHSVLKGFPGKISYDIKQTASGFQVSKSEAGHTIFTIRARDVKEFKLNGRADLHDVSIILYGRDTARFDQIYGDDFTYDPESGNVTAHGRVQIDLQGNPAGGAAPDQTTPRELKDPIHLETRDVVFNRNSGDAFTDARVDFRTTQATGWTTGVRYSAKSNTLTLVSQIHVELTGQDPAILSAAHGTVTREPREIVLDNPRLERASGTVQSEKATFFLGPENEVQRVLATGDVRANSKEGGEPMRVRADEAELLLTQKRNLLQTATLIGNVHAEHIAEQSLEGTAGRVIFDFISDSHGQDQLQKIHAAEGVHLSQRALATPVNSSASQDFDITAPVIDFFVADGRRLDRAQTSGAAKITIAPPRSSNSRSPDERTVVTAASFEAKFVATAGRQSHLASIHGAPDARIVNLTPGISDRVSTSQTLDVEFLAEGGMASVVQQGNVVYSDGLQPERRTQAWADRALYTPTDHVLLLTGNPQVTDGGMTTTAKTICIDRNTGEAVAEGNVKSTYRDLKEQAGGALLASSSPIHVTAAKMTAHSSPATALYDGTARLWQDANVIEAPSIQFDRERRSLVAQGTAVHPVTTMLVQQKPGQSGAKNAHQDIPRSAAPHGGEHKMSTNTRRFDPISPITITSARLTYSDSERLARFTSGVTALGSGFKATSDEMDAYLASRGESTKNQPFNSISTLDRMVAQGHVVIEEPNRRAVGQTLIYTASEDRFVLTGGPPSIFDAERGKITGVSLTFFRGDDRVLVEGEASTPVVTQTRVAR